MELYNSIKTDVVLLWNPVGIPFLITYCVLGVVGMLVIIFAAKSIFRASKKSSHNNGWFN